uniref:G_PROTEIN_RECEP_F1_2 domain-containing protein n=1 Tax=Caenorhabditis japonica TaxID=281687 RepID=A0A8R1I4I8_CAEJA
MRECECLHEPIEGYAGIANLMLIVLLLPLISFVGVILNFFNIFIFCEQKNTAAKYLTALSCSDVGQTIKKRLLVHKKKMVEKGNEMSNE